MTIDRMLKEIRRVISQCNAAEKDVYTALVEESEGWRCRLEELEEEDEDEDEP